MTRRSRIRRRAPRPRAAGRSGEDAAASWLAAHGFHILARNLRTRVAEIDILARSGAVLVAVEVKTRSCHAAPELTVTARQLQRQQAALRALASTQVPRPQRLRVDVVAVRTPPADTGEVRHFKGSEFAPA